MTRSALPPPSRPRQAWVLVLTGATACTCAPVAAVVGTVLTAVNQGGALLAGHVGPATAARVAANYAIPYGVSSYGVLRGLRSPDVGAPREAPEDGDARAGS